jgi:hypothetical protein
MTQGITNTTQNYKNIYNSVSTNISKISHKNLLKKTEIIRVEAGNKKKNTQSKMNWNTDIFAVCKKIEEEKQKKITQVNSYEIDDEEEIEEEQDYTYYDTNIQEYIYYPCYGFDENGFWCLCESSWRIPTGSTFCHKCIQKLT